MPHRFTSVISTSACLQGAEEDEDDLADAEFERELAAMAAAEGGEEGVAAGSFAALRRKLLGPGAENIEAAGSEGEGKGEEESEGEEEEEGGQEEDEGDGEEGAPKKSKEEVGLLCLLCLLRRMPGARQLVQGGVWLQTCLPGWRWQWAGSR